MTWSTACIRFFPNPKTAICLLLTLLSVAFCQGCKSSEVSDTAALVTVQAMHPTVGPISAYVTADATLSPLAQAAISPRITAPIRAFYVQRGSNVKAGQLLAVLENRDLTAAELDNKGQYTAAQASFNMQTKAQVPENLSKAESDVAQAKAQLDLQAQIAASRRKLFKEGAIAGREYDMAAAALVQAQGAYDIAVHRLSSLKKVIGQATIQQAEGQLSSAKGKYLAAQAQASYSEIRSPITGVVTDRPLFRGETASMGSTIITVMDTSSLLAKVHLAQVVAQRLKVGDDANVSIPGIDEPVKATVSLVSPALDPGSTTVEVWLKVNNRAGEYKAGTPVHVSIKESTVPNAITVLASSILTALDGSKYVMVVGANNTAHKHSVMLGISDGQNVQVTEGLSANDTVITNGAYGLDEGTKVTISKAGDSDAADGDSK